MKSVPMDTIQQIIIGLGYDKNEGNEVNLDFSFGVYYFTNFFKPRIVRCSWIEIFLSLCT